MDVLNTHKTQEFTIENKITETLQETRYKKKVLIFTFFYQLDYKTSPNVHVRVI